MAFADPVTRSCMHDGGRLRHSLMAFPDKTRRGTAEQQASWECTQQDEY